MKNGKKTREEKMKEIKGKRKEYEKEITQRKWNKKGGKKKVKIKRIQRDSKNLKKEKERRRKQEREKAKTKVTAMHGEKKNKRGEKNNGEEIKGKKEESNSNREINGEIK